MQEASLWPRQMLRSRSAQSATFSQCQFLNLFGGRYMQSSCGEFHSGWTVTSSPVWSLKNRFPPIFPAAFRLKTWPPFCLSFDPSRLLWFLQGWWICQKLRQNSLSPLVQTQSFSRSTCWSSWCLVGICTNYFATSLRFCCRTDREVPKTAVEKERSKLKEKHNNYGDDMWWKHQCSFVWFYCSDIKWYQYKSYHIIIYSYLIVTITQLHFLLDSKSHLCAGYAAMFYSSCVILVRNSASESLPRHLNSFS